MCQAYEGEREYFVSSELAQIEKEYGDHLTGKKPLSDEELLKLAIEKMMLSE